MTVELSGLSLLTRVRRRVLVPLGLAWALCSALSIAVSYASTAQAFDRALLDQGMGIAASLRVTSGQIDVPQSLVERASARYAGQANFAVYFDGKFVVGDSDLSPEDAAPNTVKAFENTMLRLRSVRKLTIHPVSSRPLVVIVTQDLSEREEWLKHLLAYSIVPAVVLLLVLGWWLGHCIADEVAPLGRLQRELEQREAFDLRPLVASEGQAFELTMLARTFNRLLGHIERGVRAQRQFAGDVAHEMRTPLAGMRSAAEHGLSSQDAYVWREQLQRVIGGCDRAARTIEQLLHIAASDEGEGTVALEEVRLDELVRMVLLDMMQRADKVGTDLGAEGLEEAVSIRGHPHLIEGVLRNLVDNALRYGRPERSDVLPMVTVAIRHDGGQVSMLVSDNGQGIEASDAPRLMSRWERGSGVLSGREGSGLGLAIVARYCDLMGAKWTVTRSSSGGLEVRVWFASAD